MLSVRNVSKSWGDIKALDSVSFDVDDGEFVFLVGPSGAGKTTLLRLILREILPDSGEIFLDDKDITKLKPKQIPILRQNVGVIFQDFKVLPEKTVKENIETALAVIGLASKEWKPRVDNVLDLVQLKDRDNLFPSQLSGGEIQRLTLARALVVNPKVILADEPTGNLDWDTAEHIMDLFEKINKEGKTIIMATHHKLIVHKLKKRVIELKEGKILDQEKHIKSKVIAEEKQEENKKVAKKDKIDVEEVK